MNGYLITGALVFFSVLSAVLIWFTFRDARHIRSTTTNSKRHLGEMLEGCNQPLINGNHDIRQNTIAELSALKDELKRARSSTGGDK